MAHTLLLADDSLTIQRVIELTFAEEDVEVIPVADGARAVARITSDPPDIILADVGMSPPDGYDIAAFVKNTAEYAHIPVILLTGAFEPIDEARARGVRCDAVLAKPFELPLLVERVRALLRTNGTGTSRTGSKDTTAALVDTPQDRSAAEPPGNGSAEERALAPRREQVATAPSTSPPEPSLDDRLDLIDEANGRSPILSHQIPGPSASAAGAAFPAWIPGWGEGGEATVTLDDYFDLVDAACLNAGACRHRDATPAQVGPAADATPALEATSQSSPSLEPLAALLAAAGTPGPSPGIVERALRHLLTTRNDRQTPE